MSRRQYIYQYNGCMSDEMVPHHEIYRFIDNRWRDARSELERLDSAFVHALEAYDGARNKGLLLPHGLPSPTQRLSSDWYALLECTVDTAQHLDRWALGLDKLEASTNYKEFAFYWDTWVEVGWSLSEKIGRLISLTAKEYSLGRLKDKHLREVGRIQKNFGKLRTALVHGASDSARGEKGVIARAMTEDRLWEGNVVLGFENMIPYSLFPEDQPPSSVLIPRARPVAINVLAELGAVLTGLEEYLQRIRLQN